MKNTLVVFFYLGGCPVPDSPLICTVDAAGQARAKGEGLLCGHVDKTAHFIVTGTRSPPAVQVSTKKDIIYHLIYILHKYYYILHLYYIVFY